VNNTVKFPFKATAVRCLKDSWRIYFTLLKISLPLLAAIRFLDETFDFVAVAGGWLAPLMGLMDLPGQAGIVWATAIFLQLYAAMLVLAGLWTQLDLSAAQATVLALLMLTAHALPVELRIVQKAGASLLAMLAVRAGGALLFGMTLAAIYNAGDWLQHPAVLYFAPPPVEPGWGPWFASQIKNWILIYLVILALIVFIEFLRAVHLEQLIYRALARPLSWMGIGGRAANAALIGITLGLSYGGAFFIDEARRPDVNRREMLCALTLLCLCHSLIEDTLAMVLIGAHFSGVLIARAIFSVLFMLVFARVVRQMSDEKLRRYMLAAQP